MNNEGFSRGVLYSKQSQDNYVLTRVQPSGEFAHVVETYWHVTWSLDQNKPHTQQNIPDPCINMVFERGNSRLVGAVTKRYSANLVGEGSIFGVKFRAGGFHLLCNSSVSEFTDASISIAHFFGDKSHELVDQVLNSAQDTEHAINIIEDFLRPFLPSTFDSVYQIDDILKEVKANSSITKVKQLLGAFNISERGLQRLFKTHVGVSPKWVIRKFRMQEVLARLECGETDWQSLIEHLDYFDQSHFIRDFKSLVGVSPSDYIERLNA